MSDISLRRIQQLTQAWINNVMRIYGWDRETAEWNCLRINPYREEIKEIADKLFEK
jgi:hypothetical protein